MNKILEVVKRVAANSAVRKAFYALVLAILAALGFNLAGCSSMQMPAEAPKLSPEVQCLVDAVKPVAGEQAQAVAMQLLAGETVRLQHPSPEVLAAAVADAQACFHPPAAEVDL